LEKFNVTVLIPTFNEEENLKALLPLVASWADEVLIVDSFSTDHTVSIAEGFPTRIIQREYENSASQKNWAIPQAKNNWIFLIDADERPENQLIEEVKQIVQQPYEPVHPSAYWIRRNNHFMGQRVKYCGWQGDKVIRLFRKEECFYESKHVHAEIIVSNNQVSLLKGRLIHFTFKNMDHFMQKMQRYAHWSAQDYKNKTGKIGFFHLWVKPAFRFFKHYVIQLGFLDGRTGFVVSKVLAWGVFMRYIYLLEERNAAQISKQK